MVVMELPARRLPTSLASIRRLATSPTSWTRSPPARGITSATHTRKRAPAKNEATGAWLNYREAADYCGWTVKHLRNLVSAGQVPVYGPLRRRRFKRDMLDLFLTNPDIAMRKFHQEQERA